MNAIDLVYQYIRELEGVKDSHSVLLQTSVELLLTPMGNKVYKVPIYPLEVFSKNHDFVLKFRSWDDQVYSIIIYEQPFKLPKTLNNMGSIIQTVVKERNHGSIYDPDVFKRVGKAVKHFVESKGLKWQKLLGKTTST